MKKATAITCVFVDIGGVLLTDGWDHHARKRAAANFKLELAEMEDRHHLTFYTYEEGKLMVPQKSGVVVSISSVHEQIAWSGCSPYTVSKAADFAYGG
jgi:NAD(P)-dependent dehydrogenase (short-subunit alcohol dehydrogenase family)